MSSRIFSEYTEKYSPALSRLCFLLCKNKSDAENLFRETWTKAMKINIDYHRNISFDKRLFGICVNLHKDMEENPQNIKSTEYSSDELQELFIASIPDKPASDEKYRELLACIRELPEKYRTAIVLRYFSDYSEKDISIILKIPVKTIHARLDKAKSIIKRRFRDEERDR